jgi:hypothetical protein
MMSPRRMYFSWMALILGGLFGISASHGRVGHQGTTLEMALVYGYIAWCLYWGVPPFLRWWRSTWHKGARDEGASPGNLLAAALRLSIFVTGAYFFSVLGGGLYHFARYWRSSRSRF